MEINRQEMEEQGYECQNVDELFLFCYADADFAGLAQIGDEFWQDGVTSLLIRQETVIWQNF